ncbi:unnamed protein product [Chrysoparadoxa australica]
MSRPRSRQGEKGGALRLVTNSPSPTSRGPYTPSSEDGGRGTPSGSGAASAWPRSPRRTDDAVKVAVRIRPVSQMEAAAGVQPVMNVEGNSCDVVDPTAFSVASAAQLEGIKQVNLNMWSRKFTYDYCYWSCNKEDPHYASQETVYGDLGQRVLEQAWEGYNASVFAYGQTGSGKSYTMMGTGAVLDGKVDQCDYGLIPRICHGLFDGIAKAQAEGPPADEPDDAGEGKGKDQDQGQGSGDVRLEHFVEVSYSEVYNECIKDLFNPDINTDKANRGLRLREDPVEGAYVEGLTVVTVQNYSEVAQLIAFGGRTRTVAATNMNVNSSRSHAIFTVTLRQQRIDMTGADHPQVKEKVSKINLVDLAGSERVSSTGATGVRLKEAGNINKSLATLSDVIKALSTLAACKSKGKAAPFIPYRNSVLTRLLKESLGGNARTIMLACVSPCDVHYEESMSTLKYAERAKRVRTNARVNEDDNEALVSQLEAEVAELRRQLAEKDASGKVADVVYVRDPAMEEELLRMQELLGSKEDLIKQLQLQGEGEGSEADERQGQDGRRPSFTPSKSRRLSTALNKTPAKPMEEMHMEEKFHAAAPRMALPGDDKDETLPKLVNLNQDPLFSECLIYSIKEGITVVGSSTDVDILLCAEDMLKRHAVLTHTHGMVMLCPLEGATIYVNGTLVTGEAEHQPGSDASLTPRPVLLTHRCRVIFGRYHVLRFEHSASVDASASKAVGLLDLVGEERLIDWEFAQNELLRKNPHLAPQGGGTSALQGLEAKVRELEAERSEYKDRLEKSQRELLGQRQGQASELDASVGGALSAGDERDDAISFVSALSSVPATTRSPSKDALHDPVAPVVATEEASKTMDKGAESKDFDETSCATEGFDEAVARVAQLEHEAEAHKAEVERLRAQLEERNLLVAELRESVKQVTY